MRTIFIRIFASILLLCLIFTDTEAQRKMVEEKKVEWHHDLWWSFVSVGFYAGSQHGLQVDVAHIKYNNISVGALSTYFFLPLIKDSPDDFAGFAYLAPVGLNIPLITDYYYSLGIDSRFNWLLMEDYGYPWFGEVSLRLDLKRFASFQLGYRFPSEDFEFHNQTFNFSGVFLNILAGIKELRTKMITRTVMIEDPPPRLSIRWDQREDEIYLTHDAPSKEIDLIIANDGEGIAEDVELDVYLASRPSTDLTLTNTRPQLGDFPDNSVKGASVIIRATEDIVQHEEISITFDLIEKDGFRAQRNYTLVLLPRVQPEQYPPVLTTEVEFKDENNTGVLNANERGEIVFTIYNEGRGNAWSLDGTIDLINEENIHGFELLKTDFTVPLIKPGSYETVRIPIRAAKEIPTTELEFLVTMQEANGFEPLPFSFNIMSQQFRPPQLSITEVTIKNEAGDGIIVPVEVVEFTVRIENKGDGVAEDVVFSVSPGDNVFIVEAVEGSYTERIGNVISGQNKDVTFKAFCNPRAESFPLFVTITEKEGEYGIRDYLLDFEIHHP